MRGSRGRFTAKAGTFHSPPETPSTDNLGASRSVEPARLAELARPAAAHVGGAGHLDARVAPARPPPALVGDPVCVDVVEELHGRVLVEHCDDGREPRPSRGVRGVAAARRRLANHERRAGGGVAGQPVPQAVLLRGDCARVRAAAEDIYSLPISHVAPREEGRRVVLRVAGPVPHKRDERVQHIVGADLRGDAPVG